MVNGNNSFLDRKEVITDLKRKSVQGGLIRVISNGTSAVLTLGSAIVLARLLSPEEFGLIAMVVSITDLARYLMELGLGIATVQREDISHEEVSSLFWINTAIGIVFTGIAAGLSPALAWFYGDSRLFDISIALSIIFLLRGLTVQHRSLLERQMRFGYLATINVGSNFLGICVAVLMALYGFGVWALVWRELVSAAATVAGAWLLCRWIPGLPRLSPGVRSSLRFGAELSGNSIIHYITTHLDRVLIGRFSGASALGLYGRAFQLVMTPVEQIRIAILDIGLSPLSALQSDPERYRRFYSRMLSIFSFLYMPFVTLIAIKSEDLIRLLLGEVWLSAAPLLRILSIAAFVQPVLGSCKVVMITCGLSGRYLHWGLMSGVGVIIAYAIGISWGATGVAYAYGIASYVSLILILWYGIKDTPVNSLLVIKTISLPVMSSLGAGIILVLLLPSISGTSMLVNITISFLIIMTVYLGIYLSVPKGREQLAEYWSYSAELFQKA